MGRIEAICISRAKGTVKETVPVAELRVDHGIVGDAHAGNWHRQVSLLPSESIAKVKTCCLTSPTGPSPRTWSRRASTWAA